jgi:dihydroorotate dehydrogenase electron transfer subunit
MAVLDLHPRVRVGTIVERRDPAPGVVSLTLEGAGIADGVIPGQYFMAIPPSMQAAATALAVYEAEGKRASILFFAMGPRTRELARLQIGDALSVTGPLGNGFDCSVPSRDASIVAGGVGIASVWLCAQRLLQRGIRVRLFYGARTAALLVDARRFEQLGCEVVVATDDGSAGMHGFVTAALERAVPPETIYACGPSPMLRAVGAVASRWNVRAQLSLEETFGCGVGGCWGCVVPLDRCSAQAPSFPPAAQGGSDVVFARVCKEGPVFWSDELRW